MIRIAETIVVEGKDDEAAVRRAAADANTITTSGYGISEETVRRIRTAYERTGIVIFTDPDHSGRSIRDRLSLLFPEAKHAFLTAKDARKDGDVGVENAAPETIEQALLAAGATILEDGAAASKKSSTGVAPVTAADLDRLGLTGRPDSARKREEAGARLGIGYGNAKTFLRRLNGLGIPLEELENAIKSESV